MRRGLSSRRPPTGRPKPLLDRIDIARAADVGLLEAHWKRLRKEVRAPRITRFYLASDPLEWLPFDWQLESHLGDLRSEVLSGTYRPRRAEIIRSAKSLGLTRPTAFFRPEDLLLYRNIVALADVDLMRAMRPWTRFGRADARNADDVGSPESGWFRAWLARNGQLWTLTESHAWMVETDISNFFPSVQLDIAASHVLAHSRLGVDAVRLLSYMLREFSPIAQYRADPVVGLPQDSFDCSRIIAHSFLQGVDEEFSMEGEGGRYSRYMDDIVLGAESREEGYRLISRVQSALERVGLYPNASKTRVILREEFQTEMMKEANDYLGDVDQRLRSGESVNLAEFRARLRDHLALAERPRAWERVLRRYYTASRELRDRHLLNHFAKHIFEWPGSSRHILDYVSTFRLTVHRVASVRSAVEGVGDLYQDAMLLAMQYASIGPTVRSLTLRREIARWGRATIEMHHEKRPRLAAAAVIIVGKFGDEADWDYLEESLSTPGSRDGGIFRRQLMSVLFGVGRLEAKQLPILAAESEEARRTCAFLEGVLERNDRAVGLLLGTMAPKERKRPLMYMIPPRTMFLAQLPALQADPRFVRTRLGWSAQVKRSRGERDRIGEDWLGL